MASCSVYAELLSDEFDLIGAHVTLLQHRNLALGLTQVKEQLLLFRTGAHLHQRPERKMYSWIEARIHHTA